MFRCEECKREFQQERRLRLHEITHKSDDSFDRAILRERLREKNRIAAIERYGNEEKKKKEKKRVRVARQDLWCPGCDVEIGDVNALLAHQEETGHGNVMVVWLREYRRQTTPPTTTHGARHTSWHRARDGSVSPRV